MKSELVAFLEARLAEDQELAKNADAACWHIDYCDGLGPPFHERFEPARVLAEIAAKREILGLHEMTSYPERWGEVRHHPDDKATTPGPGWALRMSARSHLGELTGGSVYACSICDADRDYGYIPRAEPGCETLLALAALYADHEDFDESWRT